VCESIHLPVQSGADRVLASMNRRYTSADYRDTVRKLRNAVPDMVITTDIIVGFPGETADDFACTMQLLQEIQYDNIFAFKYSRRPHTKALGMPGHLAEEVKEERLAQILELQKGISLRKNELHIGSVQEVLVEGTSKKGGMLTGRTRGNKAVNFIGPSRLRGSFVDLRITAAGPNSLSGELCE